MTFSKLPPVDGSVACDTCGSGAHSDLDPTRHLAVGFGNAGYSRDGEVLWEELGSGVGDFEDFPTVADVEELARQQPGADWRIFFFAPLYEAEYQRQGEQRWILVSKGQGFA